MALAIFDLDKTLIGGDSDFLWGQFLVEIGAVDDCTYQQQNQIFFDEYNAGKLDIYKYLEFCLQVLARHPMQTLNAWRDEFIQQKIAKIYLPKAQHVVDWHKNNNDTLLVITATNQFVVEPIIKMYGIDDFLATNLEIVNGKYTGKVSGTPCFQQGKITNLQNWLKYSNVSMTNSYFYSDSINDLPLLQLVDNPIVVNASDELLAIANNKQWKILSWQK